MGEKELTWTEESRKKVFDCRVFSIWETRCSPPESPADRRGGNSEPQAYTVIEAADWAIIVPVLETAQGKQFVMVRQWRHGCRELSLEFPGGVFEAGENPLEAAARELREETGYTPGRIVKIGEFSPNPAIMSNRVHFFLAENLTNTGKQELDEDEFVESVLVDAAEVYSGMGKPPYIHALMASALMLYRRHCKLCRDENQGTPST